MRSEPLCLLAVALGSLGAIASSTEFWLVRREADSTPDDQKQGSGPERMSLDPPNAYYYLDSYNFDVRNAPDIIMKHDDGPFSCSSLTSAKVDTIYKSRRTVDGAEVHLWFLGPGWSTSILPQLDNFPET